MGPLFENSISWTVHGPMPGYRPFGLWWVDFSQLLLLLFLLLSSLLFFFFAVLLLFTSFWTQPPHKNEAKRRAPLSFCLVQLWLVLVAVVVVLCSM